MKPIVLFACLLFAFCVNVRAQVAYPRFQKHMVQDGETAAAIAEHFNVTLSDFCLLNDFPTTVKLQPGQVVLVKQLKEGEKEIIEEGVYKKSKPVKSEPFATSSEDKPKSTSSKTTSTAVEEKSKSVTTTTTTKESSKPATTKETTSASQPKTTDEPTVAPPASTKAVEHGPHGEVYNVSQTGYHVVAKGQTFYRIALIYGLSVDELKDLNGMSNYNISVGQKLKVKK